MNVFSNLKTPDSWKKRLYGRLDAKEKKQVRRCVPMAAAAIAAIMLTITVSAAVLNGWTKVLTENFKDDVSAVKIVNEEYQHLDISAENDMLSVKATAFMGDFYDAYVLLEARFDEKITDRYDRIALHVKTYDNSVKNKSSYGITRYYGFPENDGSGGKVYKFKIRIYPHWIANAAQEGNDLVIDITDVHCINTEGNFSSTRSAGLSLEFAPDMSVLGQIAEYEPDNVITLNGYECTVDNFMSSDYSTRICLGYNVAGSADDWSAGARAARQIIGADIDSGSFDKEKCPVRLYVNEAMIPYISEDVNGVYSPYQIFNVTDTAHGKASDNYVCEIFFEPIDYENAESVYFIINNERIIIK